MDYWYPDTTVNTYFRGSWAPYADWGYIGDHSSLGNRIPLPRCIPSLCINSPHFSCLALVPLLLLYINKTI